MTDTIYNKLYELRACYSDIYIDLANQIELGLIPIESEEGAFINLYSLINTGLKEAISLNITSYYLIQSLCNTVDSDMEELKQLCRSIAGQDQQPF